MKNKSEFIAPAYSVKCDAYKGFTVKDVDMRKRTIQWVGNTYNFLDSDNDVLMPGCSKNSIALCGPDSEGNAKIKHALNHDLTMLPGKITELKEGKMNIKGMQVECLHGSTKMSDTQLGNDTLTNYMEEVYDNHSIGFRYLKYKFIERGHGNSGEGKEFNQLCESLINPDSAKDLNVILRVDEIKLYEVSTVAFGANELTPYLGSKTGSPEALSLKLNNRLKKLRETIKKGTQSDDMMNVIQLQIDQLETLHEELFNNTFVKNLLIVNQRVDEENKKNIYESIFGSKII